MVRRSVLLQAGLLDTRFFLYSEEVDLCRRLCGLGYQIRYCPSAVVVHEGAASTRYIHPLGTRGTISLWWHRSRFLYYRKHHGSFYTVASLAIELGWHALRLLLHTATGNRLGTASALSAMRMLRQAWVDTRGGLCSPPAPWTV